METLSQCLNAWMEAEDLTVAQLTERLGFKSKTSVFRLLHGQSSYRTCAQLCRLLAPGLDAAWRERFDRALRVEKAGTRRYAMFQALDRCFFPEKSGVSPAQEAAPGLPVQDGDVTLLGDPGESASRLLGSLLARPQETRVGHYVTLSELLTRPALLEGAISRLTDQRYRVTLLPEAGERAAALPWGLALWTSADEARIALAGAARPTWHPVDAEAAREVREALRGAEQTPLYRFDTLEAGSDYISFTEAAYQMEYNRRAVILKPTPGMQMLPADVVESTFRDFLSDNLDAVVSSRETLIYTFEKRVKNFYQRRQETVLLLSADAMTQFARTGVMPDQFYAFRPYTRGERLRVLQALSALAEKKEVTLRLFPGPGCPYSFEAYEGQGALVYPSDTCYNTRRQRYRELFLPGPEAFLLFSAYAAELCQRLPQPDTRTFFAQLIREEER